MDKIDIDKFLDAFVKEDFLGFCKHYLPHLFTLPYSKIIHTKFAEVIRRARFDSLTEGELAPRDTAKTTIFAVAAPIYWLSHNRNEKVFIVQKSGTSDSIRQVMYELDSNDKLKSDFGGTFKPSDARLKWSFEEGGVVEGAVDKKNLSIAGCGVRGSSIGKRTTKVIVDDIHDPENVATQLQRDKTIQWVLEAILPTMAPRASLFAINSSYHEDDFLNRYKKKQIKLAFKDPDGNIHTREFKINTYDSIVNEANKQTIWPEKNSYDELMFKKALMGIASFNRQYRNIVQSEETASFKRADLDKMKNPELSYFTNTLPDRSEYTAIVSSWDLAVIEDKARAMEIDSDYYVGVTVGILPNGRRRVLNVYRDRGLASPEVLNQFERIYKMFRQDLVIIESNQFQRWLADYLLRFRDYPIHKNITVGKDRAHLSEKSSALHIAVESHLWEFPYKTDEDKAITDLIIHELFYFGKDRHDDIVMSMYQLEKVLGNVQQIIAERIIQQDGGIQHFDDSEFRVHL